MTSRLQRGFREARARGQSKVTVMDAQWSRRTIRALPWILCWIPTVAQSPGFNAQPKPFQVTLVTVNNPATGVPGQQLTAATAIPLKKINDKEAYLLTR